MHSATTSGEVDWAREALDIKIATLSPLEGLVPKAFQWKNRFLLRFSVIGPMVKPAVEVNIRRPDSDFFESILNARRKLKFQGETTCRD